MSEEHAPTMIRTIRESGVVVVALSGELDSLGTRLVEPAFATALAERTTRAVVDLSGVSFMSSRALAMFVSHAKALSLGGGELHLAGANEFVSQVFQQAGFSTIFPITPTLEDALATLEE